jgi:hypothetical protein
MEFRWVALIALWTCIAGPIFGGASGSGSRHSAPKPAVSQADDGVAQPRQAPR